MIFFPYRPSRLKLEYHVKVALQKNGSNEMLPDSHSGVMVEISEGGACLILFQMLLGGKHLFFSTLDNDTYNLILLIDNPDSSCESFEVFANAVWMDSCIYQNQPAFKMGLCFHRKQKWLLRLFRG